MQIYLVGGAVRDNLLGLEVLEQDWVVVGARPKDLLNKGYTQVGKHFPVFLDPQSHEEYALARTEQKTGPGHTGFEVDAHSEVTLEQDLLRRDLTINAMARSTDGLLIDPYGGLKDLENRVLRHVSDAFSEDPLRVFRTARFYARFADFNFTIAEDTQRLLSDMSASGALRQISAERVWQEFRKSLAGPRSENFILALQGCGALDDWLAELCTIDLAELGEIWRTMDMVRSASSEQPGQGQSDAPLDWQKYVALGWLLSAEDASALSERLRVPKIYRRYLEQISGYGRMLNDWEQLSDETLLDAVGALGALRQSSRFGLMLDVISLCSDRDLGQLANLVSAVGRLGIDDLDEHVKRSGAMLGEAIKAARLEYIHTHR